MKNIFSDDKISKFCSLISSAQRIAIISHTNPDGDAVGSALALTLFLRGSSLITCSPAQVRAFVPNHFPKFLNWVDSGNDVEIFGENCAQGSAFIAAADLIVVVDFNDTRRLDRMGEALALNIHAPRVLIDHHIAPPSYDIEFHTTNSSSTAFLIYNLIEVLGGGLTLPIANALYLGIMTDTGGFSFANLCGDLYRAVGRLVDCGVDAPAINRAVFNTQSESRLRMVGYLLSEKMVVDSAHRSAYITLTAAEKVNFNHQIGDTEGLVNMPLTIEGIEFSVIAIETTECIKLSLRSTGDLDVNEIARAHFNGGGHRNAAGGKFFDTMEQSVAAIKSVISKL